MLVYGRRIHYPETKVLVESVTKEDISRCINTMLAKNEKEIGLEIMFRKFLAVERITHVWLLVF